MTADEALSPWPFGGLRAQGSGLRAKGSGLKAKGDDSWLD
jgi:hypothetical protein